jgi:hypothetical protein
MELIRLSAGRVGLMEFDHVKTQFTHNFCLTMFKIAVCIESAREMCISIVHTILFQTLHTCDDCRNLCTLFIVFCQQMLKLNTIFH